MGGGRRGAEWWLTNKRGREMRELWCLENGHGGGGVCGSVLSGIERRFERLIFELHFFMIFFLRTTYLNT